MFQNNTIILLLFFAAVLSNTAFAEFTSSLQRAQNDVVFEKFLQQQMGEYSSWLTQNQYDPSPVFEDHVKIGSTFASNVTLSCDINNQGMKDHSIRTTETIETISHFQSHLLEIIRNTFNVFDITVNVTCIGKINSENYKSNLEDVPFSGSGVLTFSVIRSTELFRVSNIGISADHKLNLEDCYYFYTLVPLTTLTTFKATWNDSRLERYPYEEHILLEMRDIYHGFLTFDQAKNQISPPFKLLNMYFLEFASGLDLKDVLSGVSLPDPFFPTPFTTTLSGEETTQASKASTMFLVPVSFLLMLANIALNNIKHIL